MLDAIYCFDCESSWDIMLMYEGILAMFLTLVIFVYQCLKAAEYSQKVAFPDKKPSSVPDSDELVILFVKKNQV